VPFVVQFSVKEKRSAAALRWIKLW